MATRPPSHAVPYTHECSGVCVLVILTLCTGTHRYYQNLFRDSYRQVLIGKTTARNRLCAVGSCARK